MIGIVGDGPPGQLTVAAGLTVKFDETMFADEAVIVTSVALATLPDVTEKVTLVLPAEIGTEDGTEATAGLPLESETITPPAGAAVAATTVPIELLPLTGEFGANVTEDN